MRDFPQVLRQARRLARHNRGFVAIVVITLAVGIGATTAAMSVAASVLHNALPLRDESRLVLVTNAIGPKQLPGELRTVVVPFKSAIVGDVRPVLILFVVAAMLVFLVGCLNVANLLLVRGTAREREIALGAALGATRSRLVGELMIESTSLAVAGGVLGVMVAFWLQRALIAAAPAGLPRLEQVGFDRRALGFAAAASMVAAALAGVVPAIWTVRRNLFGRLRSDSMIDAGTRGAQVNRQLLISLQFAFALLVTVAAALLMRSLVQLQRADLGFSPDPLSVVQVPLVGPEYRDPERRRQFFDELVSRLETLPGVSAATPVLLRPFTGKDGWDATFTAEDQARMEASANPGVHLEAVLPNYFSTMGMSIRRGRRFVDSDARGVWEWSLSLNRWRGVRGRDRTLSANVSNSAHPEAPHHG